MEDLRKIKQVGHDRARLIVDRRDELGGEMTIEDFNKMDIPDSVKEKVLRVGWFSLLQNHMWRGSRIWWDWVLYSV